MEMHDAFARGEPFFRPVDANSTKTQIQNGNREKRRKVATLPRQRLLVTLFERVWDLAQC